MGNLQVKNVPEAVHRRIRAYARQRGRTVRDVLLEAITREIDDEAFRARLASRTPVDLGHAAADTLAQERSARSARRTR